MIKATKVEKITMQFKDDEEENLEDMEYNFEIYFDYKAPPIEDYLFKHTLWPEMNKLYGHGYEIVSIDSNCDGTLIASTCKSQTALHSTIFIWDTATNQVIQKLTGHNYTVLQVRFSPSGKYLAGVSRDRQTSVFLKGESGYRNIFLQTTHTKLIHSVAISCDETLLAAGSRDKVLKIWKLSESGLADPIEFKCQEGIRSLEFSYKTLKTGSHILWVGLDNGHIMVLSVSASGQATSLMTLEDDRSHASAVNSIRCGSKANSKDIFTVATSSDDHTLRIYEYDFEQS